MVVVASWSGAAWLLQVLESCGSFRGNMDSNMYCVDILKQKRMPSLQKLFSNINHPKHNAKITIALLLKVIGDQVGLQTGTLLSTCGASSSGRWRSTLCLTSSSSVMLLCRSGRGCQQQPVQFWWIPCPGGLRQGWISMVPLLHIDTLDTVLTCTLRVYSFLLPVIWTTMVICWGQ